MKYVHLFKRYIIFSCLVGFLVISGSVWHKDDSCAVTINDSTKITEILTAEPLDSLIKKEDLSKQTKINAYYFHTTYRCSSCKKIEAFSREAIESGFAEELKNGTLNFQSINIDNDGNKHFVKDYQLYTKSLVICYMEDGKQIKWKNLAKVWELIRNKEAFIKYVQDEIKNYMKEN